MTEPASLPTPKCRGINATRFQLVAFTQGWAFEKAWSEMRAYVRKSAEHLAQGEADFADDLEQEARIALWDLDPSRFDEDDAEYVKTALRNRMKDAARKERREAGGSRMLSLSGVEEVDEETGFPIIGGIKDGEPVEVGQARVVDEAA